MNKLILSLVFLFSFSGKSFSQCDSEVREAFGGMCSMALYNTYLAIGSVADGYTSENYDSQYVQSLMSEQTAIITAVTEMINETVKSKSLTEDDHLYLKEVTTTLRYLRMEAEALSNYSKTGSESSRLEYAKNRDFAWEKIKSVMGID